MVRDGQSPLALCCRLDPLAESCNQCFFFFFCYCLKVSTWCFNFLSCALSAVITFHNRENIPKCGICVANHTTPVDVMVLHCDNSYALVHWTWKKISRYFVFYILKIPCDVDWSTSRWFFGHHPTSLGSRICSHLV